MFRVSQTSRCLANPNARAKSPFLHPTIFRISHFQVVCNRGLPATHPRGSTAFEGQRRTPTVPDLTYHGASFCPRMHPRTPRIACLHPNRLPPNPPLGRTGTHTLGLGCCAGKGTSGGALDPFAAGICHAISGSPLLTAQTYIASQLDHPRIIWIILGSSPSPDDDYPRMSPSGDDTVIRG